MFARLNYQGLGWAWDDELSKSTTVLSLPFLCSLIHGTIFMWAGLQKRRGRKEPLCPWTLTEASMDITPLCLNSHQIDPGKLAVRLHHCCWFGLWFFFILLSWSKDISGSHIIFLWLQNPPLAQELQWQERFASYHLSVQGEREKHRFLIASVF